MKLMPGVDYTPTTVSVRVTLRRQGRVVHNGFATNTDKEMDKLMNFIRTNVEAGRDVEVIHD